MDVVISFFLGSMVLSQIFMGFIVIGIIFAAISPNMRAHISHFLGNEPKKEPELHKEPEQPINITPPPPTPTQLPKAQPQIPPIVVEPQPIMTPQPVVKPQKVINNSATSEEKPVFTPSPPPPPAPQKVKSYDLYGLALQISKLEEEDIDGMEYMEDNDPRISIYKEAIRVAYIKITGDTRAIPTDLLPPYKIFVLVSIMDKDTGVYYTKKLYSYFLGDRNDVTIGDDVIVYVKGGHQRRIAKIMYISNSYVPPLNVTKSPISIKVKGKFLASKRGKRFHDPCCMQMKDKSNIIWFQSEADALNKGYAPCAKCILK